MKIVSSEQLRTFLKRESRTRSSLLPSNPFYPASLSSPPPRCSRLPSPLLQFHFGSGQLEAIAQLRIEGEIFFFLGFSLSNERTREGVCVICSVRRILRVLWVTLLLLSPFSLRETSKDSWKSIPLLYRFPPFEQLSVEFRKDAMYPPPFRSSFAYLSSPFSPPLLSTTVNYVFARSWRRGFKSCKWLHRDAHVHLRLIAPSPQLPPTWNATTRSLTRPTPSLSPSLIFTRDEHSCIRDSLIHHSLLLSFVYGRGRRDWLITLERN